MPKKPSLPWYRYLPAGLILGFGVGMSVAAFLMVWNWEDRRRNYEFMRGTEEIAKTLEGHFQSSLEAIRTVGDFALAAPSGSISSYQQFVQRPLTQHPSLEAVAWLPRFTECGDRVCRVGADQVDYQAENLDPFQITRQDEAGKLVPAPPQSEYFPIYYIEPRQSNGAYVGFELASVPAFRLGMQKAKNTGKMAIVGPFSWPPNGEGKPSLVAIEPLYATPNSDGKKELQGYIMGILRLGDLFGVAVRKSDLRYLNLYLCAETSDLPTQGNGLLAKSESVPLWSAGKNGMVYANNPCPGAAVRASLEQIFPNQTGTARSVVQVEDQQWQLYRLPTPDYQDVQTKHWRSWATLIIGLLWTHIPVTYLLTSLSRTAQIEQLASDRTRQAEQLQHAFNQLAIEQAKSERLLLNILPAAIAQRLKQNTALIADSFPAVTVLFADIVGFTKLAERISASEVVQMLNEIFSAFDRLAVSHKLEKIKTIGDAYMVVGGLPVSRPDHAEAIAEMALNMQDEIGRFNAEHRESFSMRIGIHSGPVVAGVIGANKFVYDLWGDTVNVASRMESHGIPGAIQVSESTYNRLRDKYIFIQRGSIRVKGKGDMTTYLLTSRKATTAISETLIPSPPKPTFPIVPPSLMITAHNPILVRSRASAPGGRLVVGLQPQEEGS